MKFLCVALLVSIAVVSAGNPLESTSQNSPVSDGELIADFETAMTQPAVPTAVRSFSDRFLPRLRVSAPRLTPVTKTILYTVVGSMLLTPAQAGPFTYAACLIVCEATTMGLGLLACVAGCLPALAAPSP